MFFENNNWKFCVERRAEVSIFINEKLFEWKCFLYVCKRSGSFLFLFMIAIRLYNARKLDRHIFREGSRKVYEQSCIFKNLESSCPATTFHNGSSISNASFANFPTKFRSCWQVRWHCLHSLLRRRKEFINKCLSTVLWDITKIVSVIN